MTISNPVRNIRVANRRTSIRLEAALWSAFEQIARNEGTDVDTLCTQLEPYRRNRGRTSFLRAFIVTYLVQRAFASGKKPARPYDQAVSALM
jgi:predicted DNA-binding ribbon-helix-helix protein